MTNVFKKASITLAGLAALALGGSALAGAANSSTTSTSTTPSSGARAPGSPHGSGSPPAFPSGDAPGSAAHEAAERAVTGEAAEKAKAAAVKSVPGTAGAVTTDFFGHGYEVDITRSDGTKVTVHLDSSFKVMAGPGPGHPGDGFRGGPPAGGMPPSGMRPPSGSTPPSGSASQPGSAQQSGPAPGPQTSGV